MLKAYPPIFKDIKKAFPTVTGRTNMLYAWGDRVYNPSGGPVPEWLQAHEAIHFDQQRKFMSAGRELDAAVRRWWEWYIRDPAFRFQQELPAHRAEYSSYLLHQPDKKEKYLTAIAERLSGPLYGGLITLADAKERIRK